MVPYTELVCVCQLFNIYIDSHIYLLFRRKGEYTKLGYLFLFSFFIISTVLLYSLYPMHTYYYLSLFIYICLLFSSFVLRKVSAVQDAYRSLLCSSPYQHHGLNLYILLSNGTIRQRIYQIRILCVTSRSFLFVSLTLSSFIHRVLL